MRKRQPAILNTALGWWSRRNLAQRFATLTAILIAGSAIIQGAVLVGVSLHVVHGLEAERVEQRLDRAADQFDARVNEFRKIPLILSGTPPIPRIVHLSMGGEPEQGESLDVWFARLGIIFRSILEANPDLMQARLIGMADDGRELVRVDRIGDEIKIAKAADLQHKGQRPYFKETAKLDAGEVYLSPIDANMENGRVVRPLQPTIRAGTPVFSEDGELFGIILANAAPDAWLREISAMSSLSGDFIAANQSGDYIYRTDGGPILGSYNGSPDRFQHDWPKFDRLFAEVGSGKDSLETSDSFVAAQKLDYDPAKPSEFVLLAADSHPDDVFADTWTLTLLGAAIAIALSAIGVLAAYFVSRPLKGLMSAARQIAEGKLNVSALASENRNAEIGELGEALQVMKDAVEARDASLRKSEAQLTAVIDNTIDGLFTIDRRGIVQRCNPGCETIFGFKQSEAVGRNVKTLIPGLEVRQHDWHLERYVRTGMAGFVGKRREVAGRHKSGQLIDIEVAVSEIKVGDDVLFSGIVRDITERKKVEHLKSEFVSTVTHELRTPLTSIMGSLALLRSGALGMFSPKAKRMLRIAHDNGARLVNLINDILDIDKIEAGALEFKLSDQDLSALIKHAADQIDSYAAQHGVIIKVDKIPADIVIETDPDRFQQVMGNLLSNAAKFSPEGGKVTISATMNGQIVRIAIADQGPGIPKKFQKHIFKKFAQADSSDTRLKGGTGLGLSIAKAIIERLGGNIGFETTAGEGTTFYVDMPARRVCEAKHDANGSECGVNQNLPVHAGDQSSTARTVPRILHLENDIDTCLVLQELVADVAEVTSVASVESARAQLTKHTFDLLVLDVHMQGEDARLILDYLAERDEPAPSVLVYSVKDISADDWPLVKRALVKSRTGMVALRIHILELLNLRPMPTPLRRSA